MAASQRVLKSSQKYVRFLVASVVAQMLACLQGVAALSVNWGAWAGSGMAEKAGVERMERLGFGALRPAAGKPALSHIMVALSCCAVMRVGP